MSFSEVYKGLFTTSKLSIRFFSFACCRMSSKLYSCEACGRRYKNSKSLRTHKYSYHRQKEAKPQEKGYNSPVNSMRNDFDYTSMDLELQSPNQTETGSQNFESADFIQDKVLNMEIDAVEMKADLDILKLSVSELEEVVRSIKGEMRQRVDKLNYSPIQSPASSSEQFSELKSMVQSNADEIRSLEDKVNYMGEQNDTEENDEDDSDLAGLDLLDDMNEVVNSFSQHDFEKVAGDIPKLRTVLKLILKTLDSGKLSEAEVKILIEISTASKSVAKSLLRDNFSQLVSMFKRIKMDLKNLVEASDDDQIDEQQETEVRDLDIEERDYENHESSTESSENDEGEENTDSLDSVQSDQSDSASDYHSLTSLSTIEDKK